MSVARRALNPIDRLSEILFGLIMALTFTGSLSIAEAGRDDVRTMFVGALGCNLAWGLIDAILFLMGAFAERHESQAAWNAVRRTPDPAAGREVIADAVPAVIASVITPEELETLRQRLVALPGPPRTARVDRSIWRGAAGVFVLVVVTTFPVVVPFLFGSDAQQALRVSNAIAIGMLFLIGFAYGRLTGHRPWVVGILMVLLGAALVSITMALGG